MIWIKQADGRTGCGSQAAFLDLTDIPRMNPWNAQALAFCRVPGKPSAAYAVFPALPPCPISKTTFDPSIWPFPSSFRRTPPVVMTHRPRSILRRSRSWSQSVDQPQDLLEQFSWHRDLGHLEDGAASMVYDLGADLHELLPQSLRLPDLRAADNSPRGAACRRGARATWACRRLQTQRRRRSEPSVTCLTRSPPCAGA